MQRSIKISIAAGIPFGIVAGIFFSLFYNLPAGIPGGLISGLIAGGVILFIVGPLHRRAVKRVADGGSEGSLDVHQVRQIQMRQPYDESFDLCMGSLDAINRCRVVEKYRSGGRIVARTGLNWKTWGDTITFDIKAEETGAVLVRLSSRPTAVTTIVDFGRNLQIVKTLSSYLEGHGGALHKIKD